MNDRIRYYALSVNSERYGLFVNGLLIKTDYIQIGEKYYLKHGVPRLYVGCIGYNGIPANIDI